MSRALRPGDPVTYKGRTRLWGCGADVVSVRRGFAHEVDIKSAPNSEGANMLGRREVSDPAKWELDASRRVAGPLDLLDERVEEVCAVAR